MYDPLIVDTFLRIFPTCESHDASQSPAQATYLEHLNQLKEHSRSDDLEQMTIQVPKLGEWLRPLLSIPLFTDHVAILVSIYDRRSDNLIVTEASPALLAALGLRIPLGRGLTGWAGSTKRRIANSDAALDLTEIVPEATAHFSYCMALPLLTGDGDLTGVLSLYSKSIFVDSHVRIADIVATGLVSFITHLSVRPNQAHHCAAGARAAELKTKAHQLFPDIPWGAAEITFQGTKDTLARFLCETEILRDVADLIYIGGPSRLVWLRFGATTDETVSRASRIALVARAVFQVTPLDISGTPGHRTARSA
jgi:hypothetical protein